MKRSKNRSEASIRSVKSDGQVKEEIYVPPMDTLTVKILNLRLTEEDHRHYAIKVTFFDQLIISSIIRPIGARDNVKESVITRGDMQYDPSDYEKMCLFADVPLVVHIQPLKSIETISGHVISPMYSLISQSGSNKSGSFVTPAVDTSCCNVDILPIFLDTQSLCVKKRMQPMIRPNILHRKSWDNLPLLTMKLKAIRNPLNRHHHQVLKKANHMKVTLVSSYNMIIPYDSEFVYTAASKTPLSNEENCHLVIYNQGYHPRRRFESTSFFPKWESLRIEEERFTKGDEKLCYNLKDVQNNDDIDLKYYLKNTTNTTTWASFHRTLMLGDSSLWLYKHLHRYHWPLEIHIYSDQGGYSFMTFLDLFKLLYPGEDTVRLAVPLYWVNSEMMYTKCGCGLLLTPNDKAPSTPATSQRPAKGIESSDFDSTDVYPRPTGADENNAFVIVEVKLARPLKKIVIPPCIFQSEINEMLKEMEQLPPNKRECTGRGQLDTDWTNTVQTAAYSLRRVPYYGMTEFCAFNRQLSETRTRVELMTSFWQEAAIYANNNFVIQEFLQSDNTFEEMLMMTHACLVRQACDTLVDKNNGQTLNPTLRAARHARQHQDIQHATDLYLQLVTENVHDAHNWRELATCLYDYDKEWATVCLNKAVVLDPRDPLTLLSKGCKLLEKDPDAADLFFAALLTLHPFWSTGMVAINAFYLQREFFYMADEIMKCLKKTYAEGLQDEMKGSQRGWENELGDWWDNTPILPGMNRYIDTADLLVRLRAMNLAEVCLSQALAESGESAAYFHLVAICCRLRGDVENALCHVQGGIKLFGEISYLKSLEAECLYKKNDVTKATFEKCTACTSPFCILLSLPSREPSRSRSILVDLTRRHPNAYAWIALADDWIMRTAKGDGEDIVSIEEKTAAMTCAAACAVQALKLDRRAVRAWTLLAKLVKPRTRRQHYRNMTTAWGFSCEERIETDSKESVCHEIGAALRECLCDIDDEQ